MLLHMMRKRAAAGARVATAPRVHSAALPYRDDEIVRFDALPEVDTGMISRHLFCTWHTHDTPPVMTAHLELIRSAHPSFEFGLYDLDECKQFLMKYFTSEVVTAWEELVPRSYKSDLWRFAVLYVYGGIYFDVKFKPVNGFSFEEFILPTDVFCREPDGHCPWKSITTGIMAVRPRNIYLLAAIRQICVNVRTHNYGKNSLHVTAPCLLGEVSPQNTVCDITIGPRLSNDTNHVYWKGRHILSSYPEYREEQKRVGDTYYMDMYAKRAIFAHVTIPKIIHQTWATNALPPCLQDTVNSLKSANPDWEHRLYDNAASRAFIAENFPADVLWAFDTLVPGTFKADLFRYCVMYIHGGVYLDIKYAPVDGFSFNEFWNKGQDIFVFETPGIVYQGFFMCRPRDQRVRRAIWTAVQNVKEKHYGDCQVCPTGPHLFGRTFATSDFNSTSMPLTYLEINDIGQLHFRNGGRVILRHCEGYRAYQRATYKAAGTKYWKDMWAERTIYKLENYPPPSK